MIVTVTANAAVDRTVAVGRLSPGSRIEALSEHAQAGGKGVNVARALHRLGVPVTAVVVVGGAAGDWILSDLEHAGIPARALRAPGESRTCLELVETGGRVTQVHGRGVRGSSALADALIEACDGIEATWLAVCGSLAPGLPADCVARLVERARRRGARSAVDTSGAALAAAVCAGPDLLRVNRAELADALGIEPSAASGDARSRGVGLGVVSAGEGPVLAWSAAGTRLRLDPPAVALANPVGCGDAMLAGMLSRLVAGADAAEALRFGVALAAADAESPVAGRPDPDRAAALAASVRVERWT